MKTRFKSIALALVLVLMGQFAYADTLSGKVYFKRAQVNFDTNTTVTGLGASMLTNRTRYVQLGSAPNFVLETSGLVLTGATNPIAAKVNNTPVISWVQGDTAKVSTTFRVPQDYVSGGAFICGFSLAAASTDTTVDFEVYVNSSGAAFDAATTDQTPVAKSNNTTQVQDLTLTVATDTFAAGNIVTFNVWRAAGTGGGSTLSMYNCAFSYTADM